VTLQTDGGETVGLVVVESPPLAQPVWLETTLSAEGEDPLGLQTITQDRILRGLVPGVLALSRRARYLSFFCFLLEEFQRHFLRPSEGAFSEFLRYREFEYAVAVQLCPRRCLDLAPTRALGAVSAQRVAHLANIPRTPSLKGRRGGYGQQYRSLMAVLRLVVLADEAVQESQDGRLEHVQLPTDRLNEGRGRDLAAAFRAQIAHTEYVRTYLHGDQPIPREVLQELAEHACLCGLDLPAAAEERRLLRAALLEPGQRQPPKDVRQRRLSFAHFLARLDDRPEIIPGRLAGAAAFRQAIWDARPIWDAAGADGAANPRTAIAAGWAALAAKEYYQEAVATLWAAVCRAGWAADDEGAGLTEAEVNALLRALPDIEGPRLATPGGAVPCAGDMPARDFAAAIEAANANVPLEHLRSTAEALGSTTAALMLLLTVARRVPPRGAAPPGWLPVASQDSDHQRGLEKALRLLDHHLETEPTLAEMVAWVAWQFVIDPHEQIGYARMRGGSDVFRFCWEGDRLHFWRPDERFPLADERLEAMSRMSEDLGLWQRTPNGPRLTEDGRAMARENT
jgi:hypothetical protein